MSAWGLTPRRPGGPRVPRVVVLTDRTQLPAGRGLVEALIECHRAGLEAVVVREHDLDPRVRHRLLAELARLPGLRVVSSRLADTSAHGLHLAAHQAAPGLTGAVRPWGRSCHDPAEVAVAAREGASWVTLSPFGVSTSKPGHLPPLPSSVWRGHPLPVLALGGITPDNAARARALGAHGVAVMGAVMQAPEPGEVVTALIEAVGTTGSAPVPPQPGAPRAESVEERSR
ncbi:thiamine phosphate synthase [Nocardioides sp. Y6]|uniref:Thiamine phosphate synthase n=1 Tax=Nocardioides malaquae TaxID=2773426 RepID=A0ABR9RQR2_9ACTN|nr:thiamine phosphate synthase [Nocardioides malaquae]MBE7323909.1 thiamine phosphate synthase [Nocardioides malaquae]